MQVTTARRLVAEALGTTMLLATVVGSGIMAERLSSGNVAIALLANTIATGAALVALILTFGPISAAATALFRWLTPALPEVAARVVDRPQEDAST